jgi:hypothetical protein
MQQLYAFVLAVGVGALVSACLRLIAVPGSSAVSDGSAGVTSQPIVRRSRHRVR